jgi:phage tail-like protein
MSDPAENKQSPEVYPSGRFYVSIDGSGIESALFTEVSGLQLEIDTFEYTEGGVNDFTHRLPGRVKGNLLTLKRGITKKNEFLKWLSDIAIGKIKRRTMTIILYDLKGTQIQRWDFNNVYPTKWSGPQFTATSTGVAIESVEFAHGGMALPK